MDTTGYDKFTDSKKKDFMMNFILPASIKILESKLKVKSNSIIPSFDGVDLGCNDEGNLDIDAKYKTQTTEGDFLLFVGVINEPDSGTLAYATFCAQGKEESKIIFRLKHQSTFGWICNV